MYMHSQRSCAELQITAEQVPLYHFDAMCTCLLETQQVPLDQFDAMCYIFGSKAASQQVQAAIQKAACVDYR